MSSEEFKSLPPDWWNPERDYRAWVYRKEQGVVASMIPMAHEGEIAVDLACGRGRITEILSKKGYKTFGLDINKGMLDLARKKLRDKAILIEADVLNTLLESNTAKVVTAIDITSHVDTEILLGEIARILQPEGTAVVSITNRNSLYGRWVESRRSIFTIPYPSQFDDPQEFLDQAREKGLAFVSQEGVGVAKPLSLRPNWKRVVLPSSVGKALSFVLDPVLGSKYGAIQLFAFTKKR